MVASRARCRRDNCVAHAGADADVCEDGELYELEFGVDHESIELSGSWDPVTARSETKKKVDMHPRDYLVYAYNGLLAITDELLERQERES